MMRKDTAVQAATTYLASEMTGGCFVLMGLIQLYHLFGTLEIDTLRECVWPWRTEGLRMSPASCCFWDLAPRRVFFRFIVDARGPFRCAGTDQHIAVSIITKTGVCGVILVSQYFHGQSDVGKIRAGPGNLYHASAGATRALFDVHMKRIWPFPLYRRWGLS